MGDGPADPAKSPARSPRLSHLRGRVAATTIAVATALLLTAAPASALSKNTFTTTFTGPTAAPLTNPTAVAVDQSSGDLYVSNTPINEQQSVVADATGGTYTLTFKGQTTYPIPFNASASELHDTLEQLSAVNPRHQKLGGGEGSVGIGGGGSVHGGTYTVEFKGSLGRVSQPLLTADPSHLTGASSTVTIATSRPASPAADVEKFTPAGIFLLIFGKEVNKTAVTEGLSEEKQNVCTAESGDECQPGSLGTSPGSFTDPEYLAVDESSGPEQGDVYVGDHVTGSGSGDVQKFGPQGDLITAWAKGGLLDGSEDPDGFSFAGNKDLADGIAGIAVDPAGNLFVYASTRFFEFAPGGAFLSDFPLNTQRFEEEVGGNYGANSTGLAVDAAGNLYTDEQVRASVLKFDSSGVLLAPVLGGGNSFALDPATRDLFATLGTEVAHYAPFCHHSGLTGCTPIDSFGAGHLTEPRGLALDDSTGAVYVADAGQRRIAVFDATPFLPDVTASAEPKSPTEESLEGEVNPAGAPAEITSCEFAYGKEEGSYEEGSAECEPPATFTGTAHPTATFTGLAYGTTYHYRLAVEDENGLAASYDQSFTTLPNEPAIEAEHAAAVHSDFAQIAARVNPGGGEAEYHTHYHVEYIEEEKFEEHEFQGAQQSPSVDLGSARTFQSVAVKLPGLTPNTSYRYRLVAENASSPPGGNLGPVHAFTTLPFLTEPPEPCPNAHVRQQTGASLLLDCRAYELVSAPNTAGYDVESNLTPGQTPFAGYPGAQNRLLYGVHDGGIPGAGDPTNRGVDPYLATRGEGGWSTEYVGIPAHGTPSTAPFSSTLLEADAGLHTFAFGGPQICKPCFAAPTTEVGEPLHLPNGKLVQGMAGSISQPAAEPAGYVAKPLSADGSHLVFGSKSQFEPGGDSNGEVSIYDRNLISGETNVVSKLPGEANIPCLAANCASSSGGIGELAISKEGSHVLIGQLTEEAGGAKYWHLYLNVGDSPRTIELTPGAAKGVLFDGMTEDGKKVFFSTVEHLTGEDEQHSGADLYMWSQSGEEEGEPLTLISKGNGNSCDPVANSAHEHWNVAGSEETEKNCGVVAVGGGGGVASGDGTVYFLSPEQLDGSKGTPNAPNLYVARPTEGYAPHFLATLESVLTGPQPPKLRHAFDHDFGAFTNATALAVEHSSGDVYVLDAAANTVQKFDSSGNPIGSWATGGQLTGPSAEGHGDLSAATGSGDLTATSKTITGLTTTTGAFAEGQEISGQGIESGATIAAILSSTELELSAPATETGTNVELHAGSKKITALTTSTGAFTPGEEIEAPGIPSGTTIESVGSGELQLSQSATASGSESLKAKQSFSELSFLNLPSQLAVDPSSGDLYVPDFGHGVIDKFSPEGEYLSQVGGLADPTGVAVDPATSDLYVGGLVGGVQVFSPAGTPLPALGFSPAVAPASLAVDPENGDVYITTFAFPASEEEAILYSPTGQELAKLGPKGARSVTVDPSTGDAYIDEGESVERFDSSHKLIETLPALPGHLSGSTGVAIDPGGSLYATDVAGTALALFKASLAPSPLIDNPAVLDSVTEPEARQTADFQTTPDGHFAAFPSTLPLAGKEEETAGHTEAYRYDAAAKALACASCTPTGIPSASEASLAPDGQSLASGGAVFFNTSDQLAAADTDERSDAYEWEPKGTGNCEESPTYSSLSGACTALISSGTSTFNSALLGISSDATDAFFFTRDSLVPQDENGPTVKVYDARIEGGFPYTPPQADCKASDECHGASSPPPPPLQVGSESSTPGVGNHEEEKCKKGFVRKHGKCVKPHAHKHHRHHRRGAHHKRGGKK